MVRKYLFSVLCILCFEILAESGITNSTKCGRWGDQLIEVGMSIWLADKHHVPFYLTPFKNVEHLQLFEMYPKRPKGMKARHIRPDEFDQIASDKEKLYVIYMIKKKQDTKTPEPIEIVPWKDPVFNKKLCECFSLKSKIDTVPLPEGMVSIAVHIRTGGNFDKPLAREVLTNRFTSIPFVVSSIELLTHYYNGAPLYIHIFSDDPNPNRFLEQIQKEIESDHIQWGISINTDPLVDFFSIKQFDAMIAPLSHFSFMAWVLGNHQITIRQTKARYDHGKIYVENYEIVGNDGKKISL